MFFLRWTQVQMVIAICYESRAAIIFFYNKLKPFAFSCCIPYFLDSADTKMFPDLFTKLIYQLLTLLLQMSKHYRPCNISKLFQILMTVIAGYFIYNLFFVCRYLFE